MKLEYRKIIFPSLLLVILLFSSISAHAHVEGHMPDSVAEMEYRIFLEVKPKNFEIRVKLATVLMNQDKLAEAEKEFMRALTYSPRDLQTHIGLSQLKLKQQKINEALELIKKAKEIDRNNPSVYFNFGQILEVNKQLLEASQVYKEGLSKVAQNPKGPEAQHDKELLEEALKMVAKKLSK